MTVPDMCQHITSHWIATRTLVPQWKKALNQIYEFRMPENCKFACVKANFLASHTGLFLIFLSYNIYLTDKNFTLVHT